MRCEEAAYQNGEYEPKPYPTFRARRGGACRSADPLLGLDPLAAGDRRSHQDVVLAALAMEQHLGGGEEGHEQGAPLAVGEGCEPSAERRRQDQRPAGAAVALDGGAGALYIVLRRKKG